VLLEAGENAIFGRESFLIPGVATTMVLLDGDILQDLLGRQNEGRAYCDER
jgi:hypothetical protein